MSRTLKVDWRVGDCEETLTKLYKEEKNAAIRTRLHALVLLRQGRSIADVVSILDVCDRTVRRWISWYRNGGIEEIRAHRQGVGGGRPCLLDARQQGTLWAKVASGIFLTAGEIREWIAERFSVVYARQSVYGLLERLGCVTKVPDRATKKPMSKRRKTGRRKG